MESGNVAEVMTALGDAADKSDEITRNMVGLYKKQAELEMDSAASYKQAEQDAALVSRTAGEAMLAGQVATMLDKRKLAIDTPEAVSLRTENLDEFVLKKREADERLRQIKEMTSVGFLDDPLAYIQNQLQLPTLVQQYNITGMQANSALRTVKDIDQTLTASAQQNKATAETLNDAAVGASARLAATQYKILADDKQYKALSANIMANQVVDHGNKQQVDYLLKQYEVLKSEESVKRHNEQLAMERQKFNIFMAEHNDIAMRKQRLRENIVLGSAALKMPKPNETILEAYEEDYKTPEGRARMQHIIDAAIRLKTSGIATFGVTPAETFYTIASVGDRTAGTELESVARAIGKEADALRKAGANPKDKATFGPALNQAMEAIIKKANADPENGGSLIYKAPTIERMAQNDYVANTEWFKKVLGPSVVAAKASNGTVPDIPASKIFDMTVEKLQYSMLSKEDQARLGGTLTLEQAVEGISTYYKAAGRINMVRNGQLGIKPQDGYKVNTGYSMFGGSTYDLSDPMQVTQALIARVAVKSPMFGLAGEVGELAKRTLLPIYGQVSSESAAAEALTKKGE